MIPCAHTGPGLADLALLADILAAAHTHVNDILTAAHTHTCMSMASSL